MSTEFRSILGPGAACPRACEALLRSLPDWFAHEESLLEYAAKAATLPTWTATCGDRLAGFLTILRHFSGSAEVFAMAVHAEFRNQGVGRELLAAVESWLAGDGVRWLQVKTLGPSRPDSSYEQTRRFYEARGFAPLEEFPTLWHPAVPCLLLVKTIA
jgi:GNAT superfamily N-acetyltransferase